MLPCARLAHARAACCCGCRDELRMQSAAAYSHRSDKVRSGVPLPPTSQRAALEGPLSRAAALLLCRHRLRPAASVACLPPGAVRRMQALDVEGAGERPPPVPGVPPPSRRSCCSHPCPGRALSTSVHVRPPAWLHRPADDRRARRLRHSPCRGLDGPRHGSSHSVGGLLPPAWQRRRRQLVGRADRAARQRHQHSVQTFARVQIRHR